MGLNFQRNIENFICEKCGFEVEGSGYTNHCPKCLWSKHVDIHPGDRLSHCGGLMKPSRIEGKTGEWVIVHQCERCGHNKRNKVDVSDDFDQVIKLTSVPANEANS